MAQPKRNNSIRITDQSALYEAAASGDLKAREQIILNYIDFARKLANQYADKGVPTEDLYQEACYGLIIALNHFDPSRGIAFATFASHYILKYIKRALNEQNTLYPARYSSRLFTELRKYRDAYEKLSEQHRRSPTNEELARALGKSTYHVRQLKQTVYQFQAVSEDIEAPNNKLAASMSVLNGARPVEEAVLSKILDFGDLNVSLTRREEEILKRRLGFTETGKPQAWKEISASMGFSIHWLQKNYFTAIQKLQESVAGPSNGTCLSSQCSSISPVQPAEKKGTLS